MCALVTWTVIYADFEPLAALAKLGTGDKCLQIIDVFFSLKEKEEFNILSGNFLNVFLFDD